MNEIRGVPPLNNAGLQFRSNVGCFLLLCALRFCYALQISQVLGFCFLHGNGEVSLSDCLSSPWSPSLSVFQSFLSLSLSLCPPACILDMRRAAALQGSKVINVLQMCLWAMKDWGIFPTCCLPASFLFLLLLSSPLLAHPLFSPPSISSPLTCPVSPLVYSSLLLSFSDPVCCPLPLFPLSSALLSPPLSCPCCGSTGIIKHVRVVLTLHNWHP